MKKFNLILSSVIIIILLLSTFPIVYATASSSIGKFEYEIENGEVTITKLTDVTSTIVDIPSTIKNLPVTSIGESAFSCHPNLTEVTIPNSVTSIGDYAFSICISLKKITIPDSVISLGDSAFSGCSALNEIIIPESITSIGDFTFYSCSTIENIYIPKSITSISSTAFLDCSSLSKITVDNDNPVYDSRNNCNAIIEKSTNTLVYGCKTTIIPDNILSIGRNAFNGCSSLTEINIPAKITSIDSTAFINCPEVSKITVDKNNSTYDSRNDCNAIIETATNTLIKGCRKTKLDQSLTSIGNNAFFGCSTITSLTLPANITSINGTAFSNCSELSKITVNEYNTIYDSRNNCNAIIESSTNTLVMGCKTTTIPNDVTTIGKNAFYKCSDLTEIIIPVGVTKIDEFAFSLCTNLTDITIPDSVESIGMSAFTGCTSLSNVKYTGNRTQWNNINIDNINSGLTDATIIYNHQTVSEKPTESKDILTSKTSINEIVRIIFSVIFVVIAIVCCFLIYKNIKQRSNKTNQ